MKKFCECNSDWVMRARSKDGQITADNTQEEYDYIATVACPVCEFWHWYDGQYEDMMVDLREMNRC